MKLIKFRQYHNGKFYYWGLGIKGSTFTSPTNVDLMTIDNPHQQYTGLKDKNGKEIYEGDICKLVTYCGENRFFEVKFGSVQREAKSLFDDKCTPVTITGFYFELDGMYQLYPSFYANKPDNERMEVIGNIYENPELLEANNG